MGNTQKSQNTNKNPEINNMPTYPIVNTQSNMDQNVFKSQDSYFKIKQYLKTMYKNNFVSLAFVNFNLILGRFECVLYSNGLEATCYTKIQERQ
jgi:hypothetical protein